MEKVVCITFLEGSISEAVGPIYCQGIDLFYRRLSPTFALPHCCFVKFFALYKLIALLTLHSELLNRLGRELR